MAEKSEYTGSIVIGEGVVITGSIQVPGKAVINGVLNGELSADELEVGQEGRITGTITVNKADVRGSVHESLLSRDYLIVRSTGRVHGKAVYGQIEIERGGEVAGTLGPVPAESAGVITPPVKSVVASGDGPGATTELG